MTILTFINTKKAELEARGLKFAFAPGIPFIKNAISYLLLIENLSVDAKYKLVMDKYNHLSEEQVFNLHIKLLFNTSL